MKNGKKLIFILISIAVIISLLFLAIKFSISQQIFTPGELGYLSYAEIDNGFTGLNKVYDSSYPCGYKIDTLFWTFFGGNKYCFNYQGSDKQVTIQYGTHALFNKDISNVYFKTDFITGGKSTFTVFQIKDQNGNIMYSYDSTPNSVAQSIELIPSVLTEGQSSLLINGIYKTDLTAEKMYITFTTDELNGATVTISNPRYKPKFDCYVDNDEVAVFDEFAQQTNFNINSLSYPVQKFCVNNPPQVRSFTDRGVATDENGEILIKLSQGGTINVPVNQTIRVFYITKVQAGILRCNLNEAWNTNTKKCENILMTGEEDPKLGTNITVINLGENEILYEQKYNTAPLQIGSNSISFSSPQYVCACDKEGYIYYPYGGDSCWESSYNGLKVNPNDNVKINDYVSIDYLISAEVYNRNKFACSYRDQSDWTNLLKVKVNKEGLVFENNNQNTETNVNNKKTISILLNNKIGSFTNSGFKIRTINNLIGAVSDSYTEMPLSLGSKSYEVPIDTTILGENTIEIVPYIVIQDKKVFGSSKMIFTYKVEQVNNVTYQDRIVYLDKNNTVYVDVPAEAQSNMFWIIAVSILTVIIIILILSMTRGKKRR